ncbi:hypothetical protein DSM14862_01234 [Sulfitobacter indolifex]|nr:hypothetical protein DSM14862_01234 [Sulfitobacter indolifex]
MVGRERLELPTQTDRKAGGRRSGHPLWQPIK